MKLAMIGLGKLGLPYALVLAKQHTVLGCDIDPAIRHAVRGKHWPHDEAQLPEYLRSTQLKVVDTVAEAVQGAEIVFVAVQTPHAPEHEGVTPLTGPPADFDYRALKTAVAEVVCNAARDEPPILAIISTVLPGTLDREIQPLLQGTKLTLVYHPSFIAMGSTIADLLAPEMVLVGGEPTATAKVASVWSPFHTAPRLHTDRVTAEVIKVTYNAAIGAKLVLANTVMELCHHVGANMDTVTEAFGLATSRIASGAYLRGGMGDGGGCHPRDQIALSWLAQRVGLSFDLFDMLIRAREVQTGWLAMLACGAAADRALPVFVVGQAYKAGTRITTGSPARLLVALLEAQGVRPTIIDEREWAVGFAQPAVFVLAVEHLWQRWHFPPHSVVIDPWRQVPDIPEVEVIRIGGGHG